VNKFVSNKAVILFSGGLDSTTCLAIAKFQGFACYTLSVDYGQKHAVELVQAKKIADYYDVIEHRVVRVDIADFKHSSLTDPNLPISDYAEKTTGIPLTYVPARNTIFLSLALGFAETIDASDIFLGINAVDYSNYPDCRPDFLDAFSAVATLATRSGREGKPIQIHAPLVQMNKAEIIEAGLELQVNYAETISRDMLPFATKDLRMGSEG
jgi:7-cyano-7-deazaguanine synthase